MSNLATFEAEIRERDLERLERYRRGTEDAPTLYSAHGYVKDGSGSGRVWVANEESPDRMGDVIEVAGWDLTNFKRNPVFMFQHNYNMAPIGTVPRVWKENKQLLNTVKFDMADSVAADIAGKVDRGVLRAESVGFRPLEFEEISSRSAFAAFRFTKAELLEISLVSIPAHPHALAKALGQQGRGTAWTDTEIPESILNELGAGMLAWKRELMGQNTRPARRRASSTAGLTSRDVDRLGAAIRDFKRELR